jgi:two-component system LytT family sensor kinase
MLQSVLVINLLLMSSAWYQKKWAAFMLHLSVWMFLFSLPFLLRPYMNNAQARSHEPQSSVALLRYIINDLIYIGFFYLNSGWLVPRSIYQRKYKEYAVAIVGCFIIILVLGWFIFFRVFNSPDFNLPGHVLFNFFFFLFFLAGSTAYCLIKDRINSERMTHEKETENLKTELSFLRSQVSPHFMFNIMNNMVALARKRSESLEPSLIKLSSLLRYMLYETEEKVSLQKEVEYLQSYIDLQKQRFGENVSIRSCMEKIDKSYEIEPMLLIPFVENAFKHGGSFVTKVPGSDLVLYNAAEINIDLAAEKNELRFIVKNRYNENTTETKDKTSGIGLTNVKRRLDLLYRHRHSLEIEKKDGWFITSLQITLD